MPGQQFAAVHHRSIGCSVHPEVTDDLESVNAGKRNTALTFNPKDVRAVQKDLKKKGFKFDTEADEKTTGPAFAVLFDPDHNKILFDQH